MNRYGIRAAKYVLQLTILFVVFYSVLNLVGYSKSPISLLWQTNAGGMMIGIIIFFALIQPFLGYTKKTLVFDANQRKEDVDRVMGMCGYIKVSETADQMIFRGSTTSKRLMHMFEEAITITTIDGLSVMQGPRKEVVKIYFRMGTFIG